MSLGLSIFLYWAGAMIVGGFIGYIVGYVTTKVDENNDGKD